MELFENLSFYATYENLYTRLCFCIELYFKTCYRLRMTTLELEVVILLRYTLRRLKLKYMYVIFLY
ncbi:hypothetical protein HanIR_Chr07g0309411 [Helianthus annuus]|nr:hypothetical protein HanIR_Chr07g0309411 [Helianthus annuus]